MGSPGERKIVMKKNGCRYLDPSFDVRLDYNGEDCSLIKKQSKCCKAKIIRIAGSFRCENCDNYCEIEEKI